MSCYHEEDCDFQNERNARIRAEKERDALREALSGAEKTMARIADLAASGSVGMAIEAAREWPRMAAVRAALAKTGGPK